MRVGEGGRVASPPEAGPSRALPQKPERTAKGLDCRLLSPRKIVHGASHRSHCVGGIWMAVHGVVDFVSN